MYYMNKSFYSYKNEYYSMVDYSKIYIENYEENCEKIVFFSMSFFVSLLPLYL